MSQFFHLKLSGARTALKFKAKGLFVGGCNVALTPPQVN
jgi:hypothetical protein